MTLLYPNQKTVWIHLALELSARFFQELTVSLLQSHVQKLEKLLLHDDFNDKLFKTSSPAQRRRKNMKENLLSTWKSAVEKKIMEQSLSNRHGSAACHVLLVALKQHRTEKLWARLCMVIIRDSSHVSVNFPSLFPSNQLQHPSWESSPKNFQEAAPAPVLLEEYHFDPPWAFLFSFSWLFGFWTIRHWNSQVTFLGFPTLIWEN